MNLRGQLEREGFAIAREVIDRALCDRIARVCERLTATLDEADRIAHRSTGSLIRIWRDPAFADLAAAEGALALFSEMGFMSPRFSNGYILEKPPRSPALFWHQDWWAWNEASSYSAAIMQVGLLYYLQPTSKENGCLRVIPRSHRTRHVLHEYLTSVETASLRRIDDPERPEHGGARGEIDVPADAGDVIIVDARLLHAAHANLGDAARTAITMWYFPDYPRLPEPLRATIGTQAPPDDWPTAAKRTLEPLLPRYQGDLTPSPYALAPDLAQLAGGSLSPVPERG